MAILSIQDLTFTYPRRKRPALERVSLEVEAGEWVTICGRNGSGKSTLLHLIQPELAPRGRQSGSIERQSERIGLVQQRPESQIVTDKVWHELAFGPENLGWEPEKIRLRVAETASYFGIGNWFHRDVATLSGGEKQLLNLAAVMVMDPEILLLDEPTVGLDPIATGDFIGALAGLHRDLGQTVILVEQNPDRVVEYSDRIGMLEEGRLTLDEAPKKALSRMARREEEGGFLPAPARIAYGIDPEAEDLPVNVGEGRRFLRQVAGEDLSAVEHGSIMERAGSEGKNQDDEPIALQCDNLWFRHERKEADVICGLNARVRRGECYAVLGDNGAGKTTLLQLIAGVRRPYRGRVKTGDGRVLMVPQDPQLLFSHETVKEELQEWGRMEQAMEEMGLSELVDSHPYDLSGGEQQRLALAMAMLQDPRVILLDEPTRGLDDRYRKTLGRLIRRWKKEGRTIILVSHDMEFCAEYADRCALLFDGVLTAEGRPGTFFSGNRYYTTVAARMAEGLVPGAVTPGEILEAVKKGEGS